MRKIYREKGSGQFATAKDEEERPSEIEEETIKAANKRVMLLLRDIKEYIGSDDPVGGEVSSPNRQVFKVGFNKGEYEMITMEKWKLEPEKSDFEAHGLKCAMRRNNSGSWCGYVGVDKNHPWFEKDYSHNVKVPQEIVERTIDIDKIGAINLLCAAGNADAIEAGFMDIVLAVDVHGGLTYANRGSYIEQESELWWFGFDCSHSGDYTPEYSKTWDNEAIYRDYEYVKSECESLAKQLVAVKA